MEKCREVEKEERINIPSQRIREMHISYEESINRAKCILHPFKRNEFNSVDRANIFVIRSSPYERKYWICTIDSTLYGLKDRQFKMVMDLSRSWHITKDIDLEMKLFLLINRSPCLSLNFRILVRKHFSFHHQAMCIFERNFPSRWGTKPPCPPFKEFDVTRCSGCGARRVWAF